MKKYFSKISIVPAIFIVVACVAPQAAKAAVIQAPISLGTLGNGLVDYYTMDGVNINWGTGVVADNSNHGNTGIVTNMGTTTSPVAGKVGQALTFNGTNQYVNASGIPSVSNPLTVAVWINPSALSQSSFSAGSGGTIIDENEGGGTSGWVLGVKNNNTVWFWPSSGNDKYSTATIPLNTWTHVVITYDGTNIRFYINGGLDSTQVMSAPQGSATFFRVGGKSWITGYWKGGLDDVRIYNRALSTAEAKQLYGLGTSKTNAVSSASPLASGLIGYYTLDTANINWGTGAVADSSGNGHTGTVTNLSTPASVVTGQIGQGISFTGSNQYIDTTNYADNPSNLSVAGWFKSGGDQTHSFLVDKMSNFGNGAGWTVYFNQISGGMEIGFVTQEAGGSNWEQYQNHSDIPADGLWHHFVATLSGGPGNGGIILIYIDGSSVSLDNLSRGTFTTITTAVNVRMGNDSDVEKQFIGSLDDVRVYNRTLSATEVSQLYALTTNTAITKAAPVYLNTSLTGVGGTLTRGLVGYWTMDGANINWKTAAVADNSGYSNVGAMVTMSTSTSPVAGKIGQALNFVKSFSQYVSVPSSVITPLVTTGLASVAFWMKPATLASYSAPFDCGQSGTSRQLSMLINSAGGGTVAAKGVAGAAATYSPAWTIGQWQFVVMTVDATNFKTYKNGVLNSTTAGAIGSGFTDTSAICQVGGNPSGGGSSFDGSIDDVRVYNRVLTAGEITQLYNLSK